MAFVETWMDQSVCVVFPDLPWLADRREVSRQDAVKMRAACRSCVARPKCRSFVARERICGGFWAGEFRESATVALDGAA